MYVLDGLNVLESSITGTGSVITIYKCKQYVINLTTSKKSITADGIDKAVISAQIKDYLGNVTPGIVHLTFSLNGANIVKDTDVNGYSEIDFTSLSSGKYQISCWSPGFDYSFIEVEAV